MEKLVRIVKHGVDHCRDGSGGRSILVGRGHVLCLLQHCLSSDHVRLRGSFGAMVELPAVTGANLWYHSHHSFPQVTFCFVIRKFVSQQ